MTGDWRAWALSASIFLIVLGLALWFAAGNFVVLLIGSVALLTSLAERTYGAPFREPPPSYWRPTKERFEDPDSGRLVTVWFDPSTGQRRYVADGEGLGSSPE